MTEMTRDELIASTEESWQRLDAAVAGLDDAALVEPDVVGPWSVKDLLGHVTAWDLLPAGSVTGRHNTRNLPRKYRPIWVLRRFTVCD